MSLPYPIQHPTHILRSDGYVPFRTGMPCAIEPEEGEYQCCLGCNGTGGLAEPAGICTDRPWEYDPQGCNVYNCERYKSLACDRGACQALAQRLSPGTDEWCDRYRKSRLSPTRTHSPDHCTVVLSGYPLDLLLDGCTHPLATLPGLDRSGRAPPPHCAAMAPEPPSLLVLTPALRGSRSPPQPPPSSSSSG